MTDHNAALIAEAREALDGITEEPWHATESASRFGGWAIYGEHWEGQPGYRRAPHIADATLGIMHVDRDDEEAANARLMAKAPSLVRRLVEAVEGRDKLVEAREGLAVAVREFVRAGTVLTICDRGPCQRVVEHEDRTDPQSKLFEALDAYEGARAVLAELEAKDGG